MDGSDPATFTRKAAITVGLAAAVASLLLLVVWAADLLLLLFAAVLVAVVLRALADWVSAHTRLGSGWSLCLVVVAILGCIGASAVVLVPRVSDELTELEPNLHASVHEAHDFLRGRGWGRRVLLGVGELQNGDENLLQGLGGVASVSVRGIVRVLLVAFTALYLAASPRLYIEGLVRMVPLPSRGRAREVLSAIGHTLKWFLVGRLASMFAVGVLTALGLWVLGVPLPHLLGIIAGVLTFVPYVGPILAGVPIGLVAAMDGPRAFMYAVGFYTVVQVVEGFVVTPLVQERVVALPPAVTILAEVLMGILLGAFGVVLAVPAAAAGLVAVRMLYVESVLGDFNTSEPPSS